MWESFKKRVFGLGASEGEYEEVPVIHAIVDPMSFYTREYVESEAGRRHLVSVQIASAELDELLEFIKNGGTRNATREEHAEINLQLERIQRDDRNRDWRDMFLAINALRNTLKDIERRDREVREREREREREMRGW